MAIVKTYDYDPTIPDWAQQSEEDARDEAYRYEAMAAYDRFDGMREEVRMMELADEAQREAEEREFRDDPAAVRRMEMLEAAYLLEELAYRQAQEADPCPF